MKAFRLNFFERRLEKEFRRLKNDDLYDDVKVIYHPFSQVNLFPFRLSPSSYWAFFSLLQSLLLSTAE